VPSGSSRYHGGVLSKEQKERARVDPAAVFDDPKDVLAADDLSREEKIEYLRRWRYDAIELNVAADEGMGEESSAILDRVLAALDEIDPDGDHRPDRRS